MELEIKKIKSSDLSFLRDLAVEAQSEGYNFVQRAIDEWKCNINDFSKKGEVLFGIFISNLCIGIGGLNVDSYIENPSVGRIRHVYISQKHRRKGFATLLLRKIITSARNHFEILRIYTANPSTSPFYESLGFVESKGVKVTHILKM
jgi:GNAT superfamily N-acetyltransferase